MMEIAQQTRPSILFALLWKDFQQVKSTFIAVLAGVFVVQLVLLVSASFAQNADTRTGLLGGTVTFACVAPILLALGCSGMLIGHERQSGTWAWSSSLPASWRLALSSKLLVSTFGSLFASLPLAIIPVSLLITGQLLIPESANVTLATFYISSMTIVIFFEVIVFCFLTTALLRETLTALVVAAIGLIVVQISIVAWLADSNSATAFLVRNGVLQERAGSIAFAGFVSAVLLIGCLLMVVAFRWRWGIGQQTTLTFWRSPSSVRLPSHARYRYAEGIAPSESKMMLRHACANSFWLRLIVVVSVFILLTATTTTPEAVFTIATLSACILGVTAFEGDQTLSRFRFLADRGVVPWKLVASRLAVVAVLALIIAVAALIRFRGPMDRVAFGLGLGPIALLIGAFSSVCFRKSVIAVAAALVASFMAFLVSASIINLVQSDVGSLIGQFTDFGWIVLYCSPVAIVTLLAAIFRLSRRWLVLDDAKLEPHFVWISLTALLSPLFVACTFGFLLIPNVPWPRDPVLKLASESVLVHGWFSLNEPILTDTLPRMSILSRSSGRGMEGVADSANDAVSQVRVDLAAHLTAPENNLVAVVKPLLPQLEELTRNPRQQVPQLENLIARTAALATIALGENESELALRIWRINRDLQEFAHQIDPLHTHASRNVAMHLLQQVSDRGVEAMGGPDVFKSLIPAVPDERAAFMNGAFEQAAGRRELLRGKNSFTSTVLPQKTLTRRSNIIHYFPPLMWFFERQLAVDLERQLNSTRQLSANFLTGASRAALRERFAQ